MKKKKLNKIDEISMIDMLTFNEKTSLRGGTVQIMEPIKPVNPIVGTISLEI